MICCILGLINRKHWGDLLVSARYGFHRSRSVSVDGPRDGLECGGRLI
jgi:hypothetical protein